MVRPVDQQTNLAEESLTAIRRVRLSEGVVQQLRDLIRNGRLRGGQKLPSERELAQRFEVGRSSLREAIRALELEGLVIIRPGAGSFISEESLDAALGPLTGQLLAKQAELADVVELRLLLEPQVAALAAERALDADKRRLGEILREQEQAIGRGESGAKADAAFHSAIATSIHNKAVSLLSSVLADVQAPMRDETLQTRERSVASVASHRVILDAIVTGNVEVAFHATRDHILSVNQRLLDRSLSKKLPFSQVQ